MNNNDEQKEIEKKHFELFQKLYSEINFDVENILYTETPDVICKKDGVNYGFELTSIISEGIEKHKLGNIISNKASQLFHEKYELVLYVSLIPNNRLTFKKTQLDTYANKFSDYIYSLISNQNFKDHFHIHLDYLKIQKEFRDFISISIHYHPKFTIPFWDCGEATLVPEVPLEKIKTIIEKKDTLVKDYRKVVDNICLLIVIDWANHGFYDINDKIKTIKLNTQFDNIYLLHRANSKVYKLNTNTNK